MCFMCGVICMYVFGVCVVYGCGVYVLCVFCVVCVGVVHGVMCMYVFGVCVMNVCAMCVWCICVVCSLCGVYVM